MKTYLLYKRFSSTNLRPVHLIRYFDSTGLDPLFAFKTALILHIIFKWCWKDFGPSLKNGHLLPSFIKL